MRPLRIYIAGPYSAPTAAARLANVTAAIDAAFVLLAKGHFPFIPHLTHFVDERAIERQIPLDWEDYIRWDLAWLRQCEAFLYLGSSRGADIELQVAKDLGLMLFHSIEEVPEAAILGTEPYLEIPQ
jgi:hypothetical protein